MMINWWNFLLANFTWQKIKGVFLETFTKCECLWFSWKVVTDPRSSLLVPVIVYLCWYLIEWLLAITTEFIISQSWLLFDGVKFFQRYFLVKEVNISFYLLEYTCDLKFAFVFRSLLVCVLSQVHFYCSTFPAVLEDDVHRL